jgi:hypothetical protein
MKDVVDEVILNHSATLDPKTGANDGYEYSVLLNNVWALVADDNLNSRGNYLYGRSCVRSEKSAIEETRCSPGAKTRRRQGRSPESTFKY